MTEPGADQRARGGAVGKKPTLELVPASSANNWTHYYEVRRNGRKIGRVVYTGGGYIALRCRTAACVGNDIAKIGSFSRAEAAADAIAEGRP